MKWITREGAKTDRVACPWLIKRFIDKDAEFVFVAKDQVLETAKRLGGKSFDAAGADYTHRGSKCSFEVLIEDYKLADPALARLARIVHGADIAGELDSAPEAAGLLAMAEGFHKSVPAAKAVRTFSYGALSVVFPVYSAFSMPLEMSFQ